MLMVIGICLQAILVRIAAANLCFLSLPSSFLPKIVSLSSGFARWDDHSHSCSALFTNEV